MFCYVIRYISETNKKYAQRAFCEIFFSLVFSSSSETLRLLFKKNRGTLIITPPPPSSQRVFESEMHVLCNDVPISRTTRTDGVAVYLWVPSLIFVIDVEIFGALGQYV